MRNERQANEGDYATYQIGVAVIVQEMLERLQVRETIDAELEYQPEIGVSYGELAPAVILNRMSFDPQPLYGLGEWCAEHGIDQVLGIEAEWLNDDRLGAMLEGLAKHGVAIWSQLVARAVAAYGIPLDWLHADTTTVYFEGRYADGSGAPVQEVGGPVLVAGYNKDGHPQDAQFVLSLITSQHIPLWYRPWKGNQVDDGVYLADLADLHKLGLALDNMVLIADRKLSNQANLLSLCQNQQRFLAAHPWTETAKAVWEQTWQALQCGERVWQRCGYASRNEQRKPLEQRAYYQVVEVPHDLLDAAGQTSYPLRWLFSWSSSKAQLDERQRAKHLQGGEQGLQKVVRCLGKYDYTTRATITRRIDQALGKAHAQCFYHYTLTGTDEQQDWTLQWATDPEALAQDARMDGIALTVTNVPAADLSSEEVLVKYRSQGNVEQTIDFLKSPVQIRPMWLHSPRRLAGLTLLIMIAVLLATLLEYHIRQQIAHSGQLLTGLMPEHRDTPFPTAEKLLKAFQDYTLVVVRSPDGQAVLHYPKFRPIQQRILDLLALPPCPLNSS